MKWGRLSTSEGFVLEGLRPSDDDCAAEETVNIKAKFGNFAERNVFEICA